MGRPLKGERAKKTTTISIDPMIWMAFQEIVAAKQPDGDKSASAHIERLVKKENARMSGSDMPDVVDVDVLRRELINLEKKQENIQTLIEKRDACNRFDKLAEAYNLDLEHFSNAEEVIRQILQDKGEDGSPVEAFLFDDPGAPHPESDLSLFINLAEVSAQISQTNKKIMDAHKQRYLHPPL